MEGFGDVAGGSGGAVPASRKLEKGLKLLGIGRKRKRGASRESEHHILFQLREVSNGVKATSAKSISL